MAGERTVKIKFVGDTRGLDTAAAQGGKAMGKLKTSTVAFGTAAGIALEKAGQALLQFGKDSVAAFVESEQAQLRLEDAFDRFPALADTNVEALRALNEELAKKTRFDDDATASGQAVLAGFDLTGQQIEELTPLLQDFAAKTGQDLPTAAKNLGRAFQGNTRALRQIGINYSSTGDAAQDYANITALLQEKVGGFAEEEGKSAAGQAAILENQFGELQETVGQKLLPVLLKLAEVGLKVVDFISRNKEVILPLVGIIGLVVAAQWAWNVAMAANPIGLIIIGIAALIAGIVLLVKNWDWVKEKGGQALGWIKDRAVDLGNWFTGLPGMIGSSLMGLVEILTWPFRTAFNFISDAWNNTVGRLRWSVPGWVPIIGGNTISAPQLPKFHKGGVVPGPFGAEVPILARAGEVVQTAEQARAGTTVQVFIGERELTDIVDVRVIENNRGVRRRVLAGAGAR